jgi:alpha-beta hydrolase superfamily lysophospholipase
MIETPVTFFSEGKQLVGMIHYPDCQSDRAIVMCHGYTAQKTENKRLFVETARTLAADGLTVLRFDFFGSGDSAGEFRETRVSHNIQNLKDALNLVRNLGYSKIAVLGISMGAATAILTLPQENVVGLILWSSVPDFRRLFEMFAGNLQDTLKKVDVYEHEGWLVERAFVLEALGYNIQGAFQKLDMPRLVIQGDQDEALFVQGFEEFKRLTADNVEFRLIAGARHTYDTVKHRREVIETTRDWLKRKM